MGEFTIEIARAAAGIRCTFGSTREYFRQYLTETEPDFTVEALPEDWIAEQQLLDEEADREGLRRRVFTDPFLERAVLQRKIAARLLPRNVLLLHGSTVAVDGNAYLFTARCGVGKSTHTRLWREVFGDRATMVNDDRAFLQLQSNGVLAYGSPWSGKHGIDNNICAPLTGICILERGTENRILPLSPEDGLPILLEQAFLPTEEDQHIVRQLTEQLSRTVPLWQMRCTKDPEAAQIAYRAMSG